MAVQIIDNFRLLKPLPLDDRLVINNLGDIPNYARYEGMIVYQLSDSKYYKYQGGSFSILAVAAGVETINGAEGNIVLVNGTGITISEISPGEFAFAVNGVIRTDGSVQMLDGYVPTHPKDVVTKEFMETHVVEAISESIDDVSIKKNVEDKLYVAETDGGGF